MPKPADGCHTRHPCGHRAPCGRARRPPRPPSGARAAPRAPRPRFAPTEVRVNQGRLEEAESLLVPAVRALESFEYVIAAALASLQLARTRVFLGDYDAGVAMLHAVAATVDDARVLVGSVEVRARLAEVSAFAGDAQRAAAALAEARELERELGETPLAILLHRVEVTLAAISGEPSN